jgi:hypothetical protein
LDREVIGIARPDADDEYFSHSRSLISLLDCSEQAGRFAYPGIVP